MSSHLNPILLPNGLSIVFLEVSRLNPHKEASLIVPIGEINETHLYPECAHCCEHLVSVLNPTFEKPYGFNTLIRQGAILTAKTYEDHTLYRWSA